MRDWTHPPRIEPSPLGDLPLHEFVARWTETVATPCLCGDMLLANPVDPGPGVRAHQTTERHAEWSAKVYNLR